MNRQEVEKIIKTYGSGSPEFKGRLLTERNREDGILYENDSTDDNPINVTINGTNLYVADINYLKFEVDDWGLVVRLYYDYHYIGAIVKNWEDIKTFELTE